MNKEMSAQVKIVGSIIVVVVLLVIQLIIERGYIQYGFGETRYEVHNPPKVWVWNEVTQSKGKDITCVPQLEISDRLTQPVLSPIPAGVR